MLPQAVTDRTALQDLAGRQRQAAEAVLQRELRHCCETCLPQRMRLIWN
ncbi:MAG UNVERIFIED_CONTAM: hypothetical protein LVR18_25205 [Planctomycetaceae bacterium]